MMRNTFGTVRQSIGLEQPTFAVVAGEGRIGLAQCCCADERRRST